MFPTRLHTLKPDFWINVPSSCVIHNRGHANLSQLSSPIVCSSHVNGSNVCGFSQHSSISMRTSLSLTKLPTVHRRQECSKSSPTNEIRGLSTSMVSDSTQPACCSIVTITAPVLIGTFATVAQSPGMSSLISLFKASTKLLFSSSVVHGEYAKLGLFSDALVETSSTSEVEFFQDRGLDEYRLPAPCCAGRCSSLSAPSRANVERVHQRSFPQFVPKLAPEG